MAEDFRDERPTETRKDLSLQMGSKTKLDEWWYATKIVGCLISRDCHGSFVISIFRQTTPNSFNLENVCLVVSQMLYLLQKTACKTSDSNLHIFNQHCTRANIYFRLLLLGPSQTNQQRQDVYGTIKSCWTKHYHYYRFEIHVAVSFPTSSSVSLVPI